MPGYTPGQWLLTSILASLQLKFCFYNHHQNIITTKTYFIIHMTLLSMVYCVRYIRYLFLFEEIKQFDKFHEEKVPVDTFLFFTIVKFPDNSLIFFKFWNSLIFPCREFVLDIFPVFPDFQTAWPPCICNH